MSAWMPTTHMLKERRKKRFQCVSARSLKSVLAGACVAILMAIPDCYLQEKKVLLDTHGFWTQWCTIYYAGHRECCIIGRRRYLTSNITICRLYFHQWKYSVRSQSEATSGQLWAGKQETATAAERCHSMGYSPSENKDNNRYLCSPSWE